MTARLGDRTILVTGAARGQGVEHARRLAVEGANVVLTDVDVDAAALAADEIIASGGRAMALSLDVSSEESWAEAVSGALDAYGSLFGLVNNAGISSPAGVLDWEGAGWARAIAVNQTGVVLGMRAVAPVLVEAGHGSIVNIASLWAHTGGMNGSVSYTATKAAVLGMTKSVALELAPHGIRVNSVSPGYLDHLMVGSRGNPSADGIPLGRLAHVSEFSGTVAFLMSDDASYITGVDILVDGGAILGG